MIILYTTKTCPKCNVVKTKLDKKNIPYTTVDDDSVLAQKGYDMLPVMEVEGKVLTSMIDINNFINEQ